MSKLKLLGIAAVSVFLALLLVRVMFAVMFLIWVIGISAGIFLFFLFVMLWFLAKHEGDISGERD